MSSIPASPKAPAIARWLPLILAALLAGLFAMSWQRLAAFNWSAFLAVFRQADPGWLAGAFLLTFATYWARVVRWQLMIRHLAPEARAWPLFRATAIGFTALVLLGRPGELVRPWLIAKQENVSFSSQMAVWFLERIFDLLAVLALFGYGLLMYEPGDRAVGPAIQWVLNTGGGLIAVLASACFLILFFAGRGGDAMAQRLGDALSVLPESFRERVFSATRSFSHGMSSCRSGTALLLLFAYTAAEWALITGALVCMFRAFPSTAQLTALQVVVYLGFVAFGSIVQIPGVGGGVQIAGMVVLTQLFGMVAEEAAGIAVANWLVTWVSILPFGLALAAREGLQWRNLKQISKELES